MIETHLPLAVCCAMTIALASAAALPAWTCAQHAIIKRVQHLVIGSIDGTLQMVGLPHRFWDCWGYHSWRNPYIYSINGCHLLKAVSLKVLCFSFGPIEISRSHLYFMPWQAEPFIHIGYLL